MSQDLQPLIFPLHGTRLIEASAGTGKTWTIAALYLRLVLGHGGEGAFRRPLTPPEILVMTFTKAATKELLDRIRQRLVEAAAAFRCDTVTQDAFLQSLLDGYVDPGERSRAAHRLVMAAEAMDEAAVFTIDAWCQRMLREHAFDSGCLFDEELISSEKALLREAVRDYWRCHVYPLGAEGLSRLQACWGGVATLETAAHDLVRLAGRFPEDPQEPLGDLIDRSVREQAQHAVMLKAGWAQRADAMEAWIEKNGKCFNRVKLRADTVAKCMASLREWAAAPDGAPPADAVMETWAKLRPAKMHAACNDAALVLPPDFALLEELLGQLQELDLLTGRIKRHAGRAVAARVQALKRSRRQFGFADMLARLKQALEGANGNALRQRIVDQYPVALVDEFQDTSPDQYRILDLLYQAQTNCATTGLFLIGDPKQAIYGFRGADIHAYLAARRATEGRHYRLSTNFRSAADFVQAVNHLFLRAEVHAGGAFRFRTEQEDPLPFEQVAAAGRQEQLVGATGPMPAITIWCHDADKLLKPDFHHHFAGLCAEKIVELLNAPDTGFQNEEGFIRLSAGDIAVLVRNRIEAACVREALRRRGVRSVYLSDQDSVFSTPEAADMLRWLCAIAAPQNGQLGRAAFATRTAGLHLDELTELATRDAAWEARSDQLKALRTVWQKQGVLSMLRRFMQELALPARLLAQGERELTNLLHLCEMLEAAAQQVDGEQGLIQWLVSQIEDDEAGSDERILRLESDAGLVKVVTVHKSKGLEYPLVFLPYAISPRPVSAKGRHFFDYVDSAGERQIEFALSEEGCAAAESVRMAEDVRLLYVALTRARHALWMGAAAAMGKEVIAQSALGYLLAGQEPLAAPALLPALQDLAKDCAGVVIEHRPHEPGVTHLQADDEHAFIAWRAQRYEANFERCWTISSYTSMTRDMGTLAAPASAQEEKLFDQDDSAPLTSVDDQPWHRFPRGPIPGQFMHTQLEWLAGEGFASVTQTDFAERVERRCQLAGWDHRKADVAAWLGAISSQALPPLGVALAGLDRSWPEMEFWVPATGLDTAKLDRLCQQHLLDGRPCGALQERQLRGMLRGFKDLVLQHEGRYWVLDYKSNALGRDDTAYHPAALAAAVAEHRYDVQGMIYLLSLHRLLQTRLGAAYDPARQLGGAIFFFIRGVGNQATRGCHVLQAPAELLLAADALLAQVPCHEEAA